MFVNGYELLNWLYYTWNKPRLPDCRVTWLTHRPTPRYKDDGDDDDGDYDDVDDDDDEKDDDEG